MKSCCKVKTPLIIVVNTVCFAYSVLQFCIVKPNIKNQKTILMKNTIKILGVCTMLFAAAATSAQNLSNDAVVITAQRIAASPVFKSVTYVNHANTVNLEFSVRKVQNVINYRIEAGNNPEQLELIGFVSPKKNTVLPTDFFFELTQSAASCKYFRIVEVNMNQAWTPSSLVEHPASDVNVAVK